MLCQSFQRLRLLHERNSQLVFFLCSKMGNAESRLECDALVCAIHIIARRSNQSMTLADLGALLPEHHLQVIQRKGRLRKWILKYPIFALTGPREREHITFNFESDKDKMKACVQPLKKRHTVSEEEVVEAEVLLDQLLEHVLDLIDQISNLRKQVDAQNFPSIDKLNAAIESVGGF